MVMCLDHSVEPDTDIVFVEYLLNDGFEDQIKRNEKLMAFEKLVRRIMALPHRPAVVLMQVGVWGGGGSVNDLGGCGDLRAGLCCEEVC